MKRREAIAQLKALGVTGECHKARRTTQIRVTEAESLSAISRNIKQIKSLGFLMTLYGKCKTDNYNPRTPDEMERCDSCYLSATTYR